MDPATMVVDALMTGASKALSGTASAAVTDGYKALKQSLLRRLCGRPKALECVRAAEDPDSGVDPAQLARELDAADGVDPDLLAQAQQLLALTDPDGSRSGKYRIDLHDAKGVQVGDGNTQHNTFH